MNNPMPTQQFIDIAGVKDGLIILKSGAYRLILSVSAINFALKSEQEQNALIFQYQSFLNSLHFPIQIVIQSKKLDLNQYLKRVSKIKEKQTNELIALQTEDYIDFVGQLINVANIMKKTFYVVVGYDPINLKKVSVVDKLFKKDSPAQLRISDQEYKRYKEQLLERANVVASGLGGMGLHCVQLSTEEIIELFYKIYNPEIADKERFTDVNMITTSMVQKAEDKNVSSEINLEENKETVLDNSSLVQEAQKQEAQLREREEAKEAEKQVREPEQSTSSNQSTPQAASPIQAPQTPNQPTTVPLNPPVTSSPPEMPSTTNQSSNLNQ